MEISLYKQERSEAFALEAAKGIKT